MPWRRLASDRWVSQYMNEHTTSPSFPIYTQSIYHHLRPPTSLIPSSLLSVGVTHSSRNIPIRHPRNVKRQQAQPLPRNDARTFLWYELTACGCRLCRCRGRRSSIRAKSGEDVCGEVERFDRFIHEGACSSTSTTCSSVMGIGDVRFKSSAPSAVPESKTERNQSLISAIRCFRSYIDGWTTCPSALGGRSDESKMSNS